MNRPSYCSQPSVANCWECSLTNYGLDCRNRSIAAREMGSKGGSSTSPEKKRAAAENGRKGGRPRKRIVKAIASLG